MFLLHLKKIYDSKHIIQIYIPLCFYYIESDRYRGGMWQYRFTFHYVSITSILGGTTTAIATDLHSTMFLLHRTNLMFKTRKHDVFTFHYVSITSLCLAGVRIYYSVIYIPLCFYYIVSGRQA